MPKKTANQSKTIEEQYQKKSPREHVLLRPDMYVGSLEPQEEKMWVYDEENDTIVEKMITYSPGLYKIFDEVLVNAADHSKNHDTVNKFDFGIDIETGIISVRNNGPGIAVAEHKEHKCYVPELIFGHLMTGSNFNDKEDVNRTTGGRNGYGAKLTNIYSKEFTVETVDGENKKKYVQVWRDNMSVAEKPKITTLKSANPSTYTEISFLPDYEKFNLPGITHDIYSLFVKRAIDMAGVCNGVTVTINQNKKVKFSNFKAYIEKYKFTAEEEGSSKTSTEFSQLQYYETERWKLGVVYAPDQSFKHVSFVNSICTYHGGTHVEHVMTKIVDTIKEKISKKHKGMAIKPQTIKDHLIVFIDSTIVQPSFTSQVKETLKTQVSKFGSKFELSTKFSNAILKLGIVEHVINAVQNKDLAKINKGAKKASNSVNNILKLVDAPKAGTAQSDKCWLILTEGDSAKALALAGLSMVNKDYYGVFPLKGKPLNVRESTAQQVSKNEEITNICKIMNLQTGKKYNDIKQLRYGHIVIMTDQDYDGFHIQGLLINFLHNFWPELLNIKDFLCVFTTPVIKASRGKETLSFFSIKDYEKWKETSVGKWKVKYYKGLGTSNNQEAKEYFSNLDELLKYYYAKPVTPDIDLADTRVALEAKNKKKAKKVTKEDGEEETEFDALNTEFNSITTVPKKYQNPTTEAITLAFEESRADDRKIWVKSNVSQDLDHTIKEKSYDDFINNEMVLFSIDDCERSIASAIDGLKISLRKIIHTVDKRKLYNSDKEVRVAQLAAFTSSDTAYHHGEASLVGAIKKLAQNFVGANNINLLVPAGQFGSRNMGGADAASERYIHTYLEPIVQLLFRSVDNDILNYLYDDETKIEPKMFAPILPMVLINGTAGIGTGFSSLVPKFNPQDIISIIKDRLKGEEPSYDILPWFKGFTGTVLQSNEPGIYLVYGKYQIVNETTVRITEIPLGSKDAKWTEAYKGFLDKLVETKKIESYEADMVSEPPIFVINLEESKLDEMRKKKSIYKDFKLVVKVNSGNMNLYDANGELKHYSSVKDIIDDFYDFRYKAYDDRKKFLTGKLQNELDILTWKMKFIREVISKKIVVFERSKASVIARLEELEYPRFGKVKSVNDNDDENVEVSYDYLTEMKLFSLTQDKIDELQKLLDAKQSELGIITRTTIEEQWSKEIEEFEEEYNEWVNRKPDEIKPKKTTKTTKKTTKKVKVVKGK